MYHVPLTSEAQAAGAVTRSNARMHMHPCIGMCENVGKYKVQAMLPPIIIINDVLMHRQNRNYTCVIFVQNSIATLCRLRIIPRRLIYHHQCTEWKSVEFWGKGVKPLLGRGSNFVYLRIFENDDHGDDTALEARDLVLLCATILLIVCTMYYYGTL